MKTNKKDKSPDLWKMFFVEVWANQGGGWRSLPRAVSHSEEFLQLSDQAVRLMIYLWDGIWQDRETKDVLHDGIVGISKNRMIAIGILEESIDLVKLEIVNAGFFTEIAPYMFRLAGKWRNDN